MENEMMLKEILNAFKLFSKKMDERFEKLEKKMDEGFAILDRLTVRLDGIQENLNETKETVQFPTHEGRPT